MLNIKFYINLFIGGRVVPSDGQTNRQTGSHEEANSSFSQFRESAWKYT